MKNKFNFSRRNPKTKKIENTGFMEFRNVSNNAADLYIYGDIVSSTWEAWCDEDTCQEHDTGSQCSQAGTASCFHTGGRLYEGGNGGSTG